MRKKYTTGSSKYKILAVDDEPGILESLNIYIGKGDYYFKGVTNPLEAIELLRNEHFDLLILDYLMSPIHGDKVVEKIREFNNDLYILLLTGHKDLAPPLDTIKALAIQGYCEKSDKFDQIILLVESGIKSISQMNTIKKFKDGLNKILQAVPRIYQLQPIGNILEDILSEIMPLIESSNAFILVDDITKAVNEPFKSIFRGIGNFSSDIENFMEKLTPDMMEKIGLSRTEKKTIKLDKGVIIPLVNEFSQSMGIIFVEVDDINEWMKLLEIYANQAASSINNAFLHSMVNTKNEELNQTYLELKVRYMDTIEALRQAVDAKDCYTRGHSDRVAYYCVKIGNSLGFNESEIEMLRISGIFHDIGKIGTTDDILLKTNSLDANEYDEIKKHPLKGAHILSAVSMFKEIVPIVKCHHERPDGRGYPNGIKSDDIPLFSKILSVSDAFDAMMSDRLYRSKLNIEQAKKQLLLGKGTQFDTQVVDVFLKLLENYDEMHNDICTTY